MQARVNGTTLNYQLRGPKGAPLLTLIHGFPFSLAYWKAQVPVLAKRYRVLTYDLRGLGASRLGEAPQLLEAYVDDLLGLLDWVGVRKTALLGLSMGGYIALRAAQKAPERLWALGLLDTRADADADAAKLGRQASIALVRKRGVGALAEAMLPKLFAPATLKRKPALAAGLRRLMARNGEDGVCNALVAMAGRTDSSGFLREIKVPTLVLVGEHDAITPAELARGMHRAIKDAHLAVIKGAGHVSNWEQPAAFNRAVLKFLGAARP
jgi:pimeloyl-ACP methyl ester carboxylesterase